ncbi:MAG: response regulator [Gemmataceae bacterium]|nr:response regulator [Gemmataceae bacterium]
MTSAVAPARTILVVDDNAGLVDLLQRNLTRLGYVAACATNAVDAIAKLDQLRPDLALLDLNLKDRGFEAIGEAIANRGRAVPCVLLAEHGSEARVAELMQHGVLDYLMKDAAILDLLPAVIRKALGSVERRRRLQESEFNLGQLRRNYELLLNAVGEGLCGLDLEGRITFVNAAGLRMLGYDAGELMGQDLSILADRPAAGERGMKQNVSSDTTFRCQDQFFWRKDGTSFPIEYTSTPVREGGRQVGSVFVFRDLSKRRELEDQVRQWQKLEAVGRLAGGIAHDFNNLLTVITGYNDLLRANPSLDEKGRGMTREIHDAAGRATTLTRQLLAFGQKQSLQPRTLRLARFLNQIKPHLVQALGEGISVDLDILSDIREIHADPRQLEQVFVNLASYAGESMRSGGRLIIVAENVTLRGHSSNRPPNLSPGEFVCVSVSDTGPGLPEDLLRQVFDPFLTSNDGKRGYGLGLATVYGIVLQSGGHIEASSVEGAGTTFRLFFPAKLTGMTPHGVDLSDVAGEETVLLVEPDSALRSLNVRILQGLGYRVLDAVDIAEAERLFRVAGRDVEVVVAYSPAQSAIDFIDRLRKTRSDLPAIIVATEGSPAELNGHSALARIDYPYSPEQLVYALRDLLDGVASAIR